MQGALYDENRIGCIAAPIGWLGGFLIRSLYFRHILRKKET